VYTTREGISINASYIEFCGVDYMCVYRFLQRYPVNDTKTCYYNQNNLQQIVSNNQIAKWKFDLMWGFGGTTIVLGAITLLYIIFTACSCIIMLFIR
jgi:hypothetical protein